MLDLFNGLVLTEPEIADFITRAHISSKRRNSDTYGPPYVIHQPGLLLAVLVKHISDPNVHSIRYFIPQTPFVRIGDANDARYFDMLTTEAAFNVLNEAEVLDRGDTTDRCGRRIWFLNTAGRRAFAKWQRSVREGAERAHATA
ncbi:MAG: hypothetical protein JWL75_578 [Parcubacteria group bacterium]|nr:hypothetical protein [Parcubacteria group bacterium]